MSMKKLPLHSFLAVSAMLMSLEGSGVAEAASLQVAPVLLEVPATGSTSTLTLRNEGARSLDAQIRVFKWTQDHGTEHLEPTDDVVASPPEATLASRTDYTVRVVRNSSTPVTGEEAYRLVVDELPDPLREKNGSVVVVVRHAVPLFFMPEEPETPRLRWSTDVRNGKIYVTVTNDGGRRMRISNMTISIMTILNMTISNMTISNMTISNMTISNMTISNMTISIMTISNMTISNMTISNKTISQT